MLRMSDFVTCRENIIIRVGGVYKNIIIRVGGVYKNQIPVIVNNTADNIISKLYTHSFNGYSKYIETKIIECYSTECTLDNCYICSVNE